MVPSFAAYGSSGNTLTLNRTEWDNLHSKAMPAPITSSWYAAIHDIVPTNDRLAATHLKPTSACTTCGQEDSVLHRITDCSEGPIIWNWAQARLGIILCINPHYITKEWTLRPTFNFWLKQRQAVILWILTHLLHYRLQPHRRLSLADFLDILRRSRCKLRPQPGTLPP